ncbi:thioredoxin domain-containing protein [Dethiosulfovibrio peptidovorans DSM 11002]|uniref:Thioredoxin domain-containing protein n=1 Tax=Dethiosulfovibrio peptidovorans DSM 11002 TaxID=469381 RepID=D2Z7C3_9BACT|nr:thioredoxin family protein [Dethiosulfovibrio peptidovorans]EFC91370.1 thioredoxin domain-containing protein [Dethiosulfovibrio peptidovorans DSM 11002]
MARILEGFEERYGGITVRKINLMENMDYAKKYGVRVVPTLIFLSPEEELLLKHEGIMNSEQLKDSWKELGYELEDLK